MLYLLIKTGISALSIVIISEVAKKSSFIGAFIASLPIISILSFIWIYIETKNIEKINNLSHGILLLIIPSLTLFIVLPICLNKGLPFPASITISIVLTSLSYFILISMLKYFQISI